MVLCQYEPALDPADAALPQLRAAVRLSPAASSALVTELAAAPVNDETCDPAPVEQRPDLAVLVRITVGRRDHDVYVNPAGCPDGGGMSGGIDDGTTVRVLTRQACQKLLDSATGALDGQRRRRPQLPGLTWRRRLFRCVRTSGRWSDHLCGRNEERQRIWSPPTQTRATSAEVARAKTLARASYASRGVPQHHRERAVLGRAQPEGVELLADAEVPDLVVQPQRLGPGPGGEVEQVGRGQRQTLGAEQLLGEVGLQCLLEQGEPGAAADVGTQRDLGTVLDVAAEREQPAAQRGVAGRAVRDPGTGRRPGAPALRRGRARCGRTRCAG